MPNQYQLMQGQSNQETTTNCWGGFINFITRNFACCLPACIRRPSSDAGETAGEAVGCCFVVAGHIAETFLNNP